MKRSEAHGPLFGKKRLPGMQGESKVGMRIIKTQAIKRTIVREEAGRLSQAPITETSTMQNKLHLFHLALPGSSPSLQEVKAGTGTWRRKQEPRARN